MTRRLHAGTVLWLMPLLYFVFVSAEFAALTHLTLQATAEGRSAFAVGSLFTMLSLGLLVGSSTTDVLIRRFGRAPTFTAASALATAAVLGMGTTSHFGTWIALCAALGLVGGVVWVAGESWLAEAAPLERRGFFVGLFETAVGLGLMAGPAVVPLTRALELPTLASAGALMLMALALCLPLLRVASPAEAADGNGAPAAPGAATSADWRRVAYPVAALAGISGLLEAGAASLLPSISMRLGAGVDLAAWLGVVIGAGSALLQPPMGHLGDRFGARAMVLVSWLAVIVAAMVLVAVASQPGVWLWLVGFTLGGMGGAVYTLLIVELGHRLRGSGLVKSISALVLAYSAGMAIGPSIGGALFDATGLRGLALLLVLLAGLGLAGTWRALRPVDAR